MTSFRPRLDILPPAQPRLGAEFRGTLPSSSVLDGGTALALRTGSRPSEDFRGAELVQAAPSTATVLVDRQGQVKVSFFGALTLGRVEDPSLADDTGVRVASLLDLAAQKVRVVQVRAERKDYLDLATLLAHGVTLPRALGAARALYPEFAPLVTIKALSYFGDGDLDR